VDRGEKAASFGETARSQRKTQEISRRFLAFSVGGGEFFLPPLDGSDLTGFLSKYLVDIACPIPASDRSAVLDWLLRKCVVKAHADMDCTFRMSHDFKRVQVLRGW
jgi:hypothetical protein